MRCHLIAGRSIPNASCLANRFADSPSVFGTTKWAALHLSSRTDYPASLQSPRFRKTLLPVRSALQSESQFRPYSFAVPTKNSFGAYKLLSVIHTAAQKNQSLPLLHSCPQIWPSSPALPARVNGKRAPSPQPFPASRIRPSSVAANPLRNSGVRSAAVLLAVFLDSADTTQSTEQEARRA